MSELYDVVAVTVNEPYTVRLLATGRTLAGAEGVVSMAVYRLGVEAEFYAEVPAGMYQPGDIYHGKEAIREGSR